MAEELDHVAEGLTAEQQRCVQLEIVGGITVRKKLAFELGVSEGSIYNWRKMPAYKAERARLAGEQLELVGGLFTNAKTAMLSAVPKAVSTLIEAMDDRDAEGRVTHISLEAVRILTQRLNLKDPNDANENTGGGNTGGVINVAVIKTDDGRVTVRSGDANTVEGELVAESG